MEWVLVAVLTLVAIAELGGLLYALCLLAEQRERAERLAEVAAWRADLLRRTRRGIGEADAVILRIEADLGRPVPADEPSRQGSA